MVYAAPSDNPPEAIPVGLPAANLAVYEAYAALPALLASVRGQTVVVKAIVSVTITSDGVPVAGEVVIVYTWVESTVTVVLDALNVWPSA